MTSRVEAARSPYVIGAALGVAISHTSGPHGATRANPKRNIDIARKRLKEVRR